MSSSNSELDLLFFNLYQLGCIKFGDFQLKSGIMSPIYIDLRLIVSSPSVMSQLIDILLDTLTCANIEKSDIIAGVPYTALPIAAGISLKCQWPMVLVRKEPKKYGTCREVEGIYQPQQSCLIIEDVVTTGSSILESRQKLLNDGLVVQHALAFINRSQGGVANLAKQGVQLICVTDIFQMIESLKKQNCIDDNMSKKVVEFVNNQKNQQLISPSSSLPPKTPLLPSSDHVSEASPDDKNLKAHTASIQRTIYPVLTFSERAKLSKSPLNKELFSLMDQKETNLCVAVDVCFKSELLRIADLVGPNICILKVHIDIINDFDDQLIANLEALSRKHSFYIFEDRKFADIGNTVALQYSSGSYKIVSWAHLVTSHLVSGQSSIKSLSNAASERSQSNQSPRGVILLTQMSTSDALGKDAQFEKMSMNNALECANQLPSFVSGFICQRRFSEDPGCIYYTPGVSISDKKDQQGQLYNTPESVIFHHQSDVIIVGRGITNADDIAKASILYRRRAWSCYLKRLTCPNA